jgi:NitT/TauT family transport system ATP-binding protein
VSFEIDHGEFVSVLGPSGCGKSTFLRLLAGLEQPSSGRVLFDRRPIGGPSCKVGVIFQRSTLFPWLTLAGNVEFGLYAVSSAEGAERKMALQFLDEVGLGGFEDARPDEVSGGMVQRATLARALAARPRVLLLDEPFSALDAISRLEMHQVLLEMWARTHMAIVFVTHDIDEAVELGDRVLIMGPRPGRFIGEEHVTLPRPRVMEGVVSDGFEAVRNQVARVSRAIFSGA